METGTKSGRLRIVGWGVVAAIVLLLEYVAVTGGDDLLELFIKKRTDVDDIEARVTKHEPAVRPIDRLAFPQPFPTRARIDPTRPKDLDDLVRSLFTQYNNGDHRRAAETARTILSGHPDQIDTILLNVVIHSWMGDLEGQLGEYRRNAEGPPKRAAWELGLGRVLMELGKASEGFTHFETARRLDPNLPLLHGQYGYYYERYAPRRDMGAAIREYRLEIAGWRQPHAFFGLAQVLAKVHDYGSAARVWEDYQKDFPLAPIHCVQYAWALGSAGEKDKTREVVARCLPLTTEDVGLRNNLGNALLAARLWEDARAYFEAALKDLATVGSPGLVFRLRAAHAEALLHLGETAAAAADLDQSVGIMPSARAHYLRGIARLILGDNKGADADFERCTKIHMEEEFWWQRDYEKGRSYHNARYYHHLIKTSPGKRFTAAEAWKVDRWLRDPTPADRAALSGWGCLFWGTYDAAEERLKAALALEPDNGIAWAGLVDMHRYRGDLKRALAVGDEGLARGARHTYLYNNLGYAYNRNRDYTHAEKLYSHALEMLPQNAQARINLARLLERTGRGEEALEHWNLTNAAPEFVWDPLGQIKYPALLLVNGLIVLLIIQRKRRTRGPAVRT